MTASLVAASLVGCMHPSPARVPASAQPAPGVAAELAAFDRAMSDAILHNDDAALLALWADDGVMLLPATAPVLGKPAIAAMLRDLHAKFPAAKVTAQDDHCADVLVVGDLASEWCHTHQVVNVGGSQPAVEIDGRMLLALRRESGGWRLVREMWNSGP